MSLAYEEILQNVGLSLLDLGLDDRAFLRDDAFRAVAALLEAGRSILGGDVYWRKGDTIEPAYANWYVEQRPNENASDHVARSCHEATEYIRGFVDQPGAEALFALVVAGGR